jgi:cysteine desulfurase / selenocysteine lyase
MFLKEINSSLNMNVEALRQELVYLDPKINLTGENPNPSRISLDATATTHALKPGIEAMIHAAFNYAPFERGGTNSSERISMAHTRVYNLLANLVGADSWEEIVLGQNTTDMLNGLAHTMLTGPKGFKGWKSGWFKGTPNIVTTQLEHNSNIAPWQEMQKLLKSFGVGIEVRYVGFNHETGELDMKDLEKKVNKDTRIVTVTGKSNVLGSCPNLGQIGAIAHRNGAYFIVDAAQYAPGHFIDVKAIDADFLVFSLHKMCAPFGVGVMYGKRELLETMTPAKVGGGTLNDLDESGLEFYPLPNKFMAGSPDTLGTIASGASITHLLLAGLDLQDKTAQQAFTRMVLNAPSQKWKLKYFDDPNKDAIRAYAVEQGFDEALGNVGGYRRKMARSMIANAMAEIAEHESYLTGKIIERLQSFGGFTIYGSLNPRARFGLVSFNHETMEARQIGAILNKEGVEVRSDKHCAHTLHHKMGLSSTVRVSVAPYTTETEIDAFLDVMKGVGR